MALARAVEQPELIMEHVFTTADEHDAKLLQERLVMGMDVNLERRHDLSAVIHAERLPDGRVQITVMPPLYGSYAVTRAEQGLSVWSRRLRSQPCGGLADLQIATCARTVENRYNDYRSRLAPATSTLPIVGLAPVKGGPAAGRCARPGGTRWCRSMKNPRRRHSRARRKGTLVKLGRRGLP